MEHLLNVRNVLDRMTEGWIIEDPRESIKEIERATG